MSSTDDLGSLASVMHALASTADDGPRLAPGDVIDGNYRVERVLGSGGMGVVYLARDLRLDRDVAIKIGRKVTARALAAHEEEARALAKLAHPNVVVVHAVGERDGRIYLAMEYVAGGTLREWLAAGPRTWREIVATCTAAGDGLAAAHAADIVHRDFKPENVLVGTDGRPRVADFGIARSSTDGAAPAAGTPAYMAPEQRAGHEVDARADQYAFCTTMWEALFGTRPTGDLDAPSGKAPAHVVAALRRGLADDPAARWPSLAALLRELRRDPIARRRRIAVGAGIAVVALAIGALIAWRARPAAEAPCAEAGAPIASTWSPARRARVSERFAAASLAASGQAITASLEAYATRWKRGRVAACRATRVDGSQSEAVLERRVICLEGARRHLDAAVRVLEGGAPAVLAAGDDLRATLPDLERCDDVTALANMQAVPSDPAVRDRIAAAQEQIASARVAGYDRRSEAVVLAERAAAEARTTTWLPVVAEATWVLGQQQADAGLPASRGSYEAATRLALESGHDETAAWSLADLAWQLAEDGEPELARYNVELAQALWKRLGSPAELGVRVAGAEALAAIAGASYDQALAATRRQLELARATFGAEDAVEMAGNHYNLAHALSWAGKHDEAQRELERAIALATRVVGDDHPRIARYRTLAATIAMKQGRGDEALADARRAVAILERWYGPADLRLAGALHVLGGVASAVGERELAESAITRSFALAKTRRDAKHLAELQVNLAILYVGDGKLERALELGTQALAGQESALGPDHPHSINTLVLLGYVERALAHHDRSVQFMERAVRASASLPREGGDAINARIELANSYLAAARPHDAVGALAPAIAAIEAHRDAVPDPVAAEAWFVHAQALWATGARPRARAAATSARDVFARLGTRYDAQREATAAWLARHR